MSLKTAAEALEVWDRGEPVFTVEMGGMGPGYEQCIQIVAFELIRAFKDKEFPEKQKDTRKLFDEETHRINRSHKLGLSGAQAGAAQNIAYQFLKYGYEEMLAKAPKNRRIQVSRTWPSDKPRESQV